MKIRKQSTVMTQAMKISRIECDILHDKQFKRRLEYGELMDACLKCFKEGYKFANSKGAGEK